MNARVYRSPRAGAREDDLFFAERLCHPLRCPTCQAWVSDVYSRCVRRHDALASRDERRRHCAAHGRTRPHWLFCCPKQHLWIVYGMVAWLDKELDRRFEQD